MLINFFNYYNLASNRIGFSCTQHAQCSPFGAAQCVKQCQCQNHAVYNEVTELCVPKEGLGAYCQTNTEEPSNECQDREPHSICINNECVCKENYIQTADEHCAPGIFIKITNSLIDLLL